MVIGEFTDFARRNTGDRERGATVVLHAPATANPITTPEYRFMLRVIGHMFVNGNSSLLVSILIDAGAKGYRLEIIDKILSASPDHIYLYDQSGRYIYANRSGAEALGRKQSDIIGKHWSELGFPPDIMEPFETRLKKVFSTGSTITGETSFPTVHGGRCYAYTLSPIKSEDGSIGIVVGTVSDITERKRVQEEHARVLSELNSLLDILQTIMESTNAHIAYLDTEFNFVMVNSTYERGSGHTRDELIGRNHFEFFPNPENEAIFKKARDTGETVEYKAKPFEFVDQPWRGVTYWDWTLTPAKDSAGNVIGLVLSLVDITGTVRAKQMSEALNDINATITSTLDFDEIMRRVVVEAAKAIGSESAVLALLQEGYWVPAYLYRFPAQAKEARMSDKDIPEVGLAVKAKTAIAINDIGHGDMVSGHVMEQYGVRSVLITPLLAKEEVIGVIGFSYHSAPVTFTDIQIDFANKLSTSVSLAIDNARLYEAERHIADTLQSSLLFVPERIPGVEFGHLYRSATEAAKVGGDFYDVFEIEHGRVGIMVGDVSGKGIEASALTSVVRNVIKTHAYEGRTPAVIMSKTNDMLEKSLTAPNFITVFFGILEVKTGKIAYSSAGHPPPIIKRAEGGVDLLSKLSPMIGAFPCLRFQGGKATLNKDDVLIIYTDGIVEARDNGNFFEEERLISFIEEAESIPIKVMPQAIFNRVMEFTGGKLSDDAAILVVRLTGDNSVGY